MAWCVDFYSSDSALGLLQYQIKIIHLKSFERVFAEAHSTSTPTDSENPKSSKPVLLASRCLSPH